MGIYYRQPNGRRQAESVILLTTIIVIGATKPPMGVLLYTRFKPPPLAEGGFSHRATRLGGGFSHR